MLQPRSLLRQLPQQVILIHPVLLQLQVHLLTPLLRRSLVAPQRTIGYHRTVLVTLELVSKSQDLLPVLLVCELVVLFQFGVPLGLEVVLGDVVDHSAVVDHAVLLVRGFALDLLVLFDGFGDRDVVFDQELFEDADPVIFSLDRLLGLLRYPIIRTQLLIQPGVQLIPLVDLRRHPQQHLALTLENILVRIPPLLHLQILKAILVLSYQLLLLMERLSELIRRTTPAMYKLGVKSFDLLLQFLLLLPFFEKFLGSLLQSFHHSVLVFFHLLLLLFELHQAGLVDDCLAFVFEFVAESFEFGFVLSDESFLVEIFVDEWSVLDVTSTGGKFQGGKRLLESF